MAIFVCRDRQSQKLNHHQLLPQNFNRYHDQSKKKLIVISYCYIIWNWIDNSHCHRIEIVLSYYWRIWIRIVNSYCHCTWIGIIINQRIQIRNWNVTEFELSESLLVAVEESDCYSIFFFFGKWEIIYASSILEMTEQFLTTQNYTSPCRRIVVMVHVLPSLFCGVFGVFIGATSISIPFYSSFQEILRRHTIKVYSSSTVKLQMTCNRESLQKCFIQFFIVFVEIWFRSKSQQYHFH